ncbi:MAG: D-alanyl-D-alanine carboxypeptidase/D-alanyl-D-alanine-endopeptidase [Flavobacteriales bacterium]|nr:D-alanyl-D-alanine carboxypeptidase/D-alanyl-D-alanine-endopeptidase [Flavobacteriales bacterium]
MRLTILLFGILVSYLNFSQERVTREVIEPSSIEKAITNLANDASLKNASISFYVYDATNKKEIANLNGNQSLVTASTMKAITTATALEVMGSYHKFETKLAYDGFIDSSCTLHGNIYIIGGGDPTLGSKYFQKEGEDFMLDWVDAISALGIHHIEGKIIGDDSYFSDEYVPATWGWGDMGNYYGAGVSGLSVYDNTVTFKFDAGENNNDSTYVVCYDPYTPDLRIDNRVLAGNTTTDEAYIYGGPYDPYRIIKGRIPKGSKEFEVRGAMHDPAYVTAFDLESKLYLHGITTSESASTVRIERLNGNILNSKREIFHTTISPSLSSIVYWTNLISNNLFAEHLLKHIGISQHHDGSVYSGTSGVYNFWLSKGIDMSGFYMNDGSGLSRANAISAKQLVEILTYMKKSKYADSFYSSLPNCGKTGTLSSYGKGTKIYNNLRAKSGTMTRVKSYAGYVKSADGKELVFAIIVNNFNCTTPEIGRKLEKLMISLGDYVE